MKKSLVCKVLLVILCMMIALMSYENVQAGSDSWTTSGPYGVRIYGLAVDPTNNQIVYASTPDGAIQVYKSTDGGVSWFPSNNGIPSGCGEIFNFAFDNQNPGTLYVASQAGIYKSTDYGETWQLKGIYDNNGAPYRIIAWSISSSPIDDTLFAGAYMSRHDQIGGIFHSKDGGETWELVADDSESDATISTIEIAPSAPHIIYAGGYMKGGVFKSTDSGDTWARIDSSFGVPPQIYSLAVDPNNSQVVYIGTSNGIYKTSNGGQTWSPIGTGLSTSWIDGIEIDPGNQQIIYVGGVNGTSGVYASTDNTGQNWKSMMNGMGSQKVYSIAIDNSQPQNIFAGTQNGIWKYTINSGPKDFSVSINDGALYVNTTSVKLSLTAPTGTTDMMISNDGGFAGSSWEPFSTEKNWSITSYGSNIISRIVYVKFKTNGQVSGLYQDDILLDTIAPTGSITVAAPSISMVETEWTPEYIPEMGFASSNVVYIPIITKNSRLGYSLVNLSLYATDDFSGVNDMLISNNESFTDSEWEKYSIQKEWWVPTNQTTTIHVMFRDRAGNESIPYSVSVSH